MPRTSCEIAHPTLVSRASAARPGTQGYTSGLRFAILALGPGSRCARARALATLARDTRSAPDFLRARRLRRLTPAVGHFWLNEPTLQNCNKRIAITPDVEKNGFGYVSPERMKNTVDFINKNIEVSGDKLTAEQIYRPGYLPETPIKP